MKVRVNWRKESYELELDTNEPPSTFKSLIYSISGVLPDRQKLLFKGTIIKDDIEWSSIKNLLENSVFMMIGSISNVLIESEETTTTTTTKISPPIQFIEDLTDDAVSKSMCYPAGLTNLGNSCYLNATLQCLSTVKELKEYLNVTKITTDNNNQTTSDNLIIELKNLFLEMNNVSIFTPFVFITKFRSFFPTFAQIEHEKYVQQDAEEAWNKLLSVFQPESVKKLFGIDYIQSTICSEDNNNNNSSNNNSTTSSDLRLTCHVSETGVNTLQHSITASLVQIIEKMSLELGRTSKFKVTSKISRLPKYLTVHFARFYWRTDIKQRVKIRRNIKFPNELDMTQYCTIELQNKIQSFKNKSINNNNEDPFENKSGLYELCAVLSHIGVSSESGHYIAWIKKEDLNNKSSWFKMDDEKVTCVELADVLKTSGVSADSHIAYMLLYRSIDSKQENLK